MWHCLVDACAAHTRTHFTDTNVYAQLAKMYGERAEAALRANYSQEVATRMGTLSSCMAESMSMVPADGIPYAVSVLPGSRLKVL